jgi:hypothetical protein
MPATLGDLQVQLVKTPIGANVDLEKLRGSINRAIETICRSRPWTRLEKEGVLQTLANYTAGGTGTVSINIGATTGVGVGTVFTNAMNGWRIRIGNLIEWYGFVFVDALNFGIDRPYLGPDGVTNAVGLGFTMWQPVYSLPSDLGELYSIQNLTRGGNLTEWSRTRLDDMATSRILYGDALAYVPAGDLNGVAQIEIYPGPDNVARGYPIKYRQQAPQLSSTSDMLPDWFNTEAVYRGALMMLYGDSDDQARENAEEARFMRAVGVMANEDARRKPPEETNLNPRYTQHRVERTLRNYGRGASRNWRGA